MMSWAITSGPHPSKLLCDDSYPQDLYIHLSIQTMLQTRFPLSVDVMTPSLRLNRAMNSAHSLRDAGTIELWLADAFLPRYQVCPYLLVNAVFRLNKLFYQTRYYDYPFTTKLQKLLFAHYKVSSSTE